MLTNLLDVKTVPTNHCTPLPSKSVQCLCHYLSFTYTDQHHPITVLLHGNLSLQHGQSVPQENSQWGFLVPQHWNQWQVNNTHYVVRLGYSVLGSKRTDRRTQNIGPLTVWSHRASVAQRSQKIWCWLWPIVVKNRKRPGLMMMFFFAMWMAGCVCTT